MARITPVQKKERWKYRRIACTSSMLKVFENLLLQQLHNDTDDNLQFAYKSSRSTLDAVAYLVHSVASALDRRCKSVRMLFLDYKNSFGSLDQNVLLSLLLESGVTPQVLNIVQNYFSNRHHYTRFSGQRSSSLPITSGVLQGVILSPTILFNLC